MSETDLESAKQMSAISDVRLNSQWKLNKNLETPILAIFSTLTIIFGFGTEWKHI